MLKITRRQWLAGSVMTAAFSGAASGLSIAQSATLDLSSTRLHVGEGKPGSAIFMEAAGVADTPYVIDYAQFPAGPPALEALAAGSVDIAPMADIPPIFALKSGAPVRIIAVLHSDVNNLKLLAPKDSTVKGIADLRGKRVGYTRSTISHYFLLELLKEQGMTFKDIIPVNLTPQDGMAAFSGGNLDGWVIFGIYGLVAGLKSGARTVKTALGYLEGNYVFAAYQKSIADPLKHAALSDYLVRQRKIYQWMDTHPDEWAEGCSKATGVPREIFLQQFRERSQATRLAPVDAVAIAAQQKEADAFFAAGDLPEKIDVTPLWDRSFNDVLK